MNWLEFEVRSQGYSETTRGQMSFGRYFLTYLHGHILMKLSQFLITGPRDTNDLRRIMSSTVKLTQTFSENALFGGGILIDIFRPIEEHLVIINSSIAVLKL